MNRLARSCTVAVAAALLVIAVAERAAAEEDLCRLREEVSSIAHEGSSTKTVHVTVSVGITLLDPDVSVEESIDRADKALYLAKSRGRNQTVVWDASML